MPLSDKLSLDNIIGPGPARALKLFALCVILAKIILIFVLSNNTFFVMDEYAHAAHTGMIQDFYVRYFPFKTVLSAYFYLPAQWLSSNSAEAMLIARYQMALAGVGVVVFVYLICLNMGRTKLEALFTVCVLLAFSTFMERVFRVRTEPLCLAPAMGALWITTSRHKSGWILFLAGLMSGVAFLTTQKAVYFNFALGVALIAEAVTRKAYAQAFKKAAIFTFGWAVIVVAYSVYFRGPDFLVVLNHIFVTPVRLAVHGGEDYKNLREFVLMTLSRNAFVYGLCFAGLSISLARFKKLSVAEVIVIVFTLIMTFFVFTHNQPWPYVFIMVIPFLSLYGIEAVKAVPAGIPYLKGAVLISALVVMTFSFKRNIHYFGHTNLLQNMTSMQAESLLGPDDSYCDGAGMLVKKRFAGPAWWDARGIAEVLAQADKNEFGLIENILSYRPKVWILNYRTSKLWPVLEPFLVQSYVRVFPNVLVSGVEISAEKPVKFINRWEGAYALYSNSGARLNAPFYINSKIIKGSTLLKIGEYTAQLADGADKAYLLPDNIKVPFTIPPARKPMALFRGVYRY
ncbi:hypothetical protein MNBD_NITROSPINAE03-1003 [hydrothermal vent metagenome]|uniref:DUF7056 domain-containing protein n=1 Tax=hydrothermal vent metagenome TaxID=652676 RepID=A0A3B1BMK3_9ZZZZ